MFITKSVSFWNRLVNLYVLIVSQRYKVVAIVTVQQCLMGPGALNGPAGRFLQARVRPLLTPRHNNYFADPDLVYRGNTWRLNDQHLYMTFKYNNFKQKL